MPWRWFARCEWRSGMDVPEKTRSPDGLVGIEWPVGSACRSAGARPEGPGSGHALTDADRARLRGPPSRPSPPSPAERCGRPVLVKLIGAPCQSNPAVRPGFSTLAHAVHVDDVVAESVSTMSEIPPLPSFECRRLEIGDHRSALEPSQVSRLRSGALVFRALFGDVGEAFCQIWLRI